MNDKLILLFWWRDKTACKIYVLSKQCDTIRNQLILLNGNIISYGNINTGVRRFVTGILSPIPKRVTSQLQLWSTFLASFSWMAKRNKLLPFSCIHPKNMAAIHDVHSNPPKCCTLSFIRITECNCTAHSIIFLKSPMDMEIQLSLAIQILGSCEQFWSNCSPVFPIQIIITIHYYYYYYY